MVMKELPPRTTEILRIPPTEEQAEMHSGNKKIISTILSKKYITEMDMLRLQKALLLCRMTADSTFLVDKTPPGYSSKLKELESLLEQLFQEEDRKIILFSEWTTNAGATGLNLQAANTVINIDLPWNPAILEQRISRAHRMGQKNPVHVYLLVTGETIEESLLNTLSAKYELAMAALDVNSDVNELSFQGSIEELKRRLEVLLGAKPAAPVDESRKAEVEHEVLKKRKKAIAGAGGQLIGAAFSFIGELLGDQNGKDGKDGKNEKDHLQDETENKYMQVLSDCLEKNEDGSLQMTIRFPDDSALKTLEKTLSSITKAAGKD